MRIDGSSARSHAVKSTQDYALVETSILYSGIEVLNANSNVIRNNEIIGGDAWGASLVAKGGARNFEAYNNVVHIQSVWGQGIVLGGTTGTQWLYDPSSGIEAYNSVAYNNVVINEASGTALSYGMMGATDSALFNNVMKGGTLYLQGSGGSGKTPVNPTIKNNIFTCTGAQVLGQWSYTGQLSLDYNNFFNCSGVPTQAHPITGDPMFVNPSADWHLAPGSPAINSGTSVEVRGFKGEALTVNRDKDGKTRTTPWDLGIYETNSVTGDTTPPNAPSNLRLL